MEHGETSAHNELSRLRRLGRYLRPGRGVFLIISIHLIAFVFLYLGLIRLVQFRRRTLVVQSDHNCFLANAHSLLIFEMAHFWRPVIQR